MQKVDKTARIMYILFVSIAKFVYFITKSKNKLFKCVFWKKKVGKIEFVLLFSHVESTSNLETLFWFSDALPWSWLPFICQSKNLFIVLRSAAWCQILIIYAVSMVYKCKCNVRPHKRREKRPIFRWRKYKHENGCIINKKRNTSDRTLSMDAI